MEIRVVRADEFEEMMGMYYDVMDALPQSKFFDWKRGGYPQPERIKRYIENGEAYAGFEDGKIICAAVLNHRYNDGYSEAPWQIEAGEEETLMVHTLAVHPSYHGKGVSGALVEEIKNIARGMGLKAVRPGNIYPV